MGGLGCGASCAKYLLMLLNTLVLLAGATVLGIGIWLLVDHGASKYIQVISVDTTESVVKAAIIIFVIIGGIAFVIGFFGCVGACKEYETLLLIYAVLVSLLLLLQIAAGILAAVYRKQLEKKLEDSMYSTVTERYGTTQWISLTQAWDFLQVEFNCCGSNNYSDWARSVWRNTSNMTYPYPHTCCKLTNSDYNSPMPVNETQCMSGNNGYIYTVGCFDAGKSWLDKRVVVLIAVAFGLLAIQIVAIIMACCLRKAVSNQNAYA